MTDFRLLRNYFGILKHRSPQELKLMGPYLNFEDAMASATGYNSPIILEKVLQATIDLLEGRGVYERDGTVFFTRPDNLKIRQLLQQYLQPGMTVVDFGGGLGGTYINHREIFKDIYQFIVVEQDIFVTQGTKMSSKYSLPIKFLSKVSDLSCSPDIFILSSVLQYLPDCDGILELIDLIYKPKLIIIDRTIMTSSPKKYWWIQDCSHYYKENISIPIKPICRKSLSSKLGSYIFMEEWINSFDLADHQGILFGRKEIFD